MSTYIVIILNCYRFTNRTREISSRRVTISREALRPTKPDVLLRGLTVRGHNSCSEGLSTKEHEIMEAMRGLQLAVPVLRQKTACSDGTLPFRASRRVKLKARMWHEDDDADRRCPFMTTMNYLGSALLGQAMCCVCEAGQLVPQREDVSGKTLGTLGSVE